MFVTDLTAFAQNDFYPKTGVVYPCELCGVQFYVTIAVGVKFVVKCDGCGVTGIVSTKSMRSKPDISNIGTETPVLDPTYLVEMIEAD